MRCAALLLSSLIGCSGPQQAAESTGRDDDGVTDVADRCPEAPEDLDGVTDDDGCPDVDDDADGVLDVDDLCPCDPEDADGWEDINGCPDPDNDADGLVDGCDRCPLEPETGDRDVDGCPDPAIDVIVIDQVVDEHVRFARNAARIPPEAGAVLDEIVETMRARPEILRAEVQGHASVRERDPDRLAQRRADAVRDALISRGIEPNRLLARGYRADHPLDAESDGDDRRVELHILESAPPPPRPQPPCTAPEPPEPRCDARAR